VNKTSVDAPVTTGWSALDDEETLSGCVRWIANGKHAIALDRRNHAVPDECHGPGRRLKWSRWLAKSAKSWRA